MQGGDPCVSRSSGHIGGVGIIIIVIIIIIITTTTTTTTTIIIIVMMMMMMIIMMNMMIIIIIIIIITFKGANQNSFTISSLRRELSPTRTLEWPECIRVQITCNTSSAYHVQHVVLRATWYEGTAQLLNLTEFEIAFFFSALFYWLDH